MRFPLLLFTIIKNAWAIVDMGLKPHVKTEVTLLELHDPKLPKSVGHSMNGFGFQGEKVKNKIVINLLFKVIHPKYYKHLKKAANDKSIEKLYVFFVIDKIIIICEIRTGPVQYILLRVPIRQERASGRRIPALLDYFGQFSFFFFNNIFKTTRVHVSDDNLSLDGE